MYIHMYVCKWLCSLHLQQPRPEAATRNTFHCNCKWKAFHQRNPCHEAAHDGNEAAAAAKDAEEERRENLVWGVRSVEGSTLQVFFCLLQNETPGLFYSTCTHTYYTYMNTCDWPVALRRMRSQQLIMLICAPLIILKENLKMQQNVASAVKTTQSTHVHTGSQRCVNGGKNETFVWLFYYNFYFEPWFRSFSCANKFFFLY